MLARSGRCSLAGNRFHFLDQFLRPADFVFRVLVHRRALFQEVDPIGNFVGVEDVM